MIQSVIKDILMGLSKASSLSISVCCEQNLSGPAFVVDMIHILMSLKFTHIKRLEC